MSEAFLKVVNMSISAGWLVLAVLVLRLILKKAPKWVNVLLWGIVAIRLICPFSIESEFSLMPESLSSGTLVNEWTDDYIGHNHFINEDSEYYDDAIAAGREPISDGEGGHYVATGADRISDPFTVRNTVVPKLAILWGIGMSLMVAYTSISYLTLRHKLRTAVILRENIFQCETVSSPFVLGILKPRIYLPYVMDGKNLSHVIAHEKAHIRRKDHWWKPLGFLLLTIHWFNPLMWIAYILLCRDIELACDEKVIADLENDQRADYTQALVTCAVNRRMIAACPLAFGEVGVKDRVKSIMNYRKPTFWIIVTALVVCVVVAVCFLTDPNPSREFTMSGNNVSNLNPEAIVERILDIEDITNSGVYMNSMNFSLQVDSDFNWADSQAVTYFFMKSKTTYKGQLRIFPHEEKFFLTEPSEGQEQHSIFLLRHYLDAIKYLPQEAIRQMAPGDQYIISQREEGTPGSYDRVITYTQNGVEDIDGWYIHLEIQPLHTDGDAFSGTGDEVIHVFYSGNGFDGDRSQLDQLQADKVLMSRMDVSSGARSEVTVTDQKTISQLLSIYKSLEVEDYSRPLNDERIMLQFFSGDNMILDWYVSFYEEDDEVVTCGDAFGLGNKRVVTEFDYDWLLSLCAISEIEFTGNRNLGLNAEIIDIDYDQKILYVKDIDESAAVFGDRCAVDCSYAISRDNLIYVNYEDPNDLRTISFVDFQVGDSVIISLYESEKEKAFNGRATADQIQLGTQRLNYKYVLSYEPLGVSGDNVKELSTPPDDVIWQDGFAINELAPGEEIVSDYEIIIDENGTDLFLTLSWGSAALVLKYGIRAADGTEYFQEKPGGYSHLRIKDLPAGTYHLFVRNSDAYHGIPAYENPEDFPDVSFNATGAILYAFDN